MRNFLKKLYPDHDELAIFTMAVSIIALAIFDADFRTLLLNGLNVMFVEIPGKEFEQGFWHGIKLFSGAMMLLLVSVFALVGSLYLPFTRQNLDVMVTLVVFYHVILLFTANFLAWDKDQNPVSAIFFVGSFLWTFGFFIKHRRSGSTIETTHRQASAREAAIAGISVLTLVAVCSAGFGLHWAHCYGLAMAYAIGLTQFFESRLQAA